MLKKLLLGAVAVLAVGFTTSAYADVDLLVTVTKDKEVDIRERVSITKDVDITVDVILDAVKAAEASSIVNQSNHDNTACENCAEKQDEIIGSVNGNSGVASVNQAGGNSNNQGNVLTAAVDVGRPPTTPPGGPTPGGSTPGGFAHAQGHVDQKNGVKTTVVPNTETEDPNDSLVSQSPSQNIVKSAQILFRSGIIDGSINNNFGLAMVNQAPGQMNNQANVMTIALALSAGGVSLAEADLGQVTANNESHESDVVKDAQITDSISGNNGVTMVNQAVGNMSNQANNLSIAAAVFVSDL